MAAPSGGIFLIPGGPPGVDATGFCVNDVSPVLIEAPNLYFILDRSGSMLEPLPNTRLSKYRAAKAAIVDVLRSIGHRVQYGATIFPAVNNPTGCSPGSELQSPVLGDPYSYTNAGKTGPILSLFTDKLDRVAPPASGNGGTPTAATLAALVEPLAALSGTTVAVLLTDGAPNCNASATCDANGCIANIILGPEACTPYVNCCSPDTGSPDAPRGCFDKDPTAAAVKALAERGIRTFVVGMPGSEAFSDLLNQLAELGGTARSLPTRYYPVNDTDALGTALLEIGSSVTKVCDIKLTQTPPDPTLLNVFLDNDVIAQSETNGWAWTTPTAISLRGEACDRVKLGNVQQVQVVAGCPTVIR